MDSPDKGYRRIHDDLERFHNVHSNDKRILRICRSLGIQPTVKFHPAGCTRHAKTPQHYAENILNRESGKGVGWVKAQVQRMKAQVVFIDYLQLLAASKAKDRYQQITSISIGQHPPGAALRLHDSVDLNKIAA